ncbi:toxin-antitoxin system HicB family antitoxin [Nocardioides sp. HDW12B]|nr:toxin-antitoxin system HicB family antitoxin [Nocardioides sp. HDW12B]
MVHMDITPYVEGLRRDLLIAAEGAGEEVRTAVERLTYALDPSARLALMEAVSQAAAEITAALPETVPSAGVDVRLDGRELDFVVHPAVPAMPAPPAPPAPPTAPTPDVDDGVVRLTLRIPESLKARAEEAAEQAGQSLNTWLVGAVRDATRTDAVRIDVDLSSIPFGEGFPFHRGGRNARRMTGWV